MVEPGLAQPKNEPFDAFLLGRRLRAVREVAGYDQVQWAAKIGKVSQTVSNWELGRSSPTYDDLIKYGSMLGCDLHWLLTGRQFNPFEVIQAMMRMMTPDTALQEPHS
jgi:transcriptional regulator with XRE-family HTH domain